MQPIVVFQPSGRRVAADPAQNLLELALKAGLELEGNCGGKGVCGKCLVQPHGAFSPPDSLERELLGDRLPQGYRLACQCSLPRGGTVWVPPESLLRDQVILTAGREVVLGADPVVESVHLTLEPPTLSSPTACQKRLRTALEQRGALGPGTELHVPLSLLQALPRVAEQGEGCLTALLRQRRQLVGLSSESSQDCLGLAVDLGTTTVVAYLFDLVGNRPLAIKAAMNPQVQWGDDVISRISHCGRDSTGLRRLAAMAAQCVNHLAKAACQEANSSQEQIVECVMVGNTAMHHIFLGLDPFGLALAPYVPVLVDPISVKAHEVGLALAAEAWVHWLPVKAGFVGADTVAVALATGVGGQPEPTLVLDLGTNGEMILAHAGRIICCSTAAGPAFEGAHIRCGMRGAPGAVERVSLEPVTLEPKLGVIGGGSPQGICGSGLVSAVSQLLAAGALLPGGSFDPDTPSRRLRPGPQGTEFLLASAQDTASEQDLVLTGQDVAEVQLAKGAIRAGVEILMAELGVERLSRVLLAGAFGNYLDPADARALGLFPSLPLERVEAVGNAAGMGAIMALTSRAHRQQAAALDEQMQYLELSGHPLFQDYFTEGMAFPERG